MPKRRRGKARPVWKRSNSKKLPPWQHKYTNRKIPSRKLTEINTGEYDYDLHSSDGDDPRYVDDDIDDEEIKE